LSVAVLTYSRHCRRSGKEAGGVSRLSAIRTITPADIARYAIHALCIHMWGMLASGLG